MTDTVWVRVRVDKALKKEATLALAEMQLTITDVVRIVLTKAAKDKSLPFDMLVPNSQ